MIVLCLGGTVITINGVSLHDIQHFVVCLFFHLAGLHYVFMCTISVQE